MGLILFFELFAQDSSSRINCLQDIFCCTNCADYPFTDAEKDDGVSYKKPIANAYPGDKKYTSEDGKGDCNPGSNGCNKGAGILFYDVYYPDDYVNYKTCPLPAVVFVHGGGFSECNPINPSSDECEYFARRGFVCYNVSYRIGTRLTPDPFYPYFSVQQQLAIYRANQDVRGAIRSIIQRQMDQDALPDAEKGPYQINTDLIFLAGQSAGAITILNVAYYDQAMINTVNRYANTTSISDALGPIDADYYYGGTTIEYVSKIKGICDQWGGVSVPGQYYDDSTNAKNFFTRRIPVIAFHGQQDPVVPFYKTKINLAINDLRPGGFGLTYVTETTCLLTGITSFKTDDNNSNNPDFAIFGSYSFFHLILQAKNIPSELYVDCQAMHGLDDDGPNYKSDYGTGYFTQTQTIEYIVERAAVFFKNVMTGNAQRRENKTLPETDKVFNECRNNYIKCNTLEDNNANCSNDDICE